MRKWLVAIGAGVAAALACVTVVWAVLGLLAGGAEGLLGGFLSSSAGGVLTTAAAATGGPVDWVSPALGSSGRIWPVAFLPQGSPLMLLVLGPVVAGLVAGLLSPGRAGTGPRGPRGLRGRLGGLLVTGSAYGLVISLAGPLANRLAPGELAIVSTPVPVALVLGALWCAAIGLLAQTLLPRLQKFRGLLRLSWRNGAGAALLCLLLVGQLVLPGSAVAVPVVPASATGGPSLRTGGTMAAPSDYYRPGVKAALTALGTGPGARQLARDPWLGVPTLVTMDSPAPRGAGAWLRDNAALFAVADPLAQLRSLPQRKDPHGLKHDWYQQVIGGVPVYGARVAVHRDATGKRVESLTNGMVPGLDITDTTPTLAAEAAATAATRALPGSKPVEPPELYVLPGDAAPGAATPATLTWRVWVARPDGDSMAYFVDARSTGRIVRFEPVDHDALDRRIWDFDNRALSIWDLGRPYPEGEPAREEGDPPVAAADVNRIYEYSGDSYNFYLSEFGRNSFDDEGSPMRSIARYTETDGEPLVNAMFMPDTGMTAFGDGMATLDVVAHEWQHGVTFHTADLLSLFQGGALHESFSDVFASLVEAKVTGHTNWVMGDGSKIKPENQRHLDDPHATHDDYGRYPAHYSEYRMGCTDSGWVHANSLIPSHAWYILVTRIGAEKVAQIAYRDLSMYLGPRSRFTDTRVGAIQSAYDLYGKTSQEAIEVARAFGAVGIDGTYESPYQFCLCFADESLTGAGLRGLDPQGASTDATVAALLRTRELFEDADHGGVAHYADLYARTNSRAMQLLAADDSLRQRTAHLMQAMEPAFRTVGTQQGNGVVVTQKLMDEIVALAEAYAEADAATPGGGTARGIMADERSKVDPQDLVGMTVNQVLAHLDSIFS